MTRRPALLLLAASLAVSPAAAVQVVEKSPFDRLGVTARRQAAAGTGVAAADDPDSLAANPAAIATLELRGAHFFTSNLGFGSRYYAAALTGVPLGGGRFSAGYMRADAGDLAGRATELDDASSYDASDQALVFGYGRSVWKRLGLLGGVSARYVRKDIADVSGEGFGLDAGLFRAFRLTDRQTLTAGAAYLNAVPLRLRMEETSTYKGSLRGGLGWQTAKRSGLLSGRARVEWNAQKDFSAGLAHALGAEYDLGLVSFRGGFREGDASFGLGFRFMRDDNTFQLDYGMQTREYSDGQNVSLSWLFGVAKEEAGRAERMQKWSAKKQGKVAYAEGAKLAQAKDYWKAREKFEEASAWMPERDDWAEKVRETETRAVDHDRRTAIETNAVSARAMQREEKLYQALVSWRNVQALDPQNLEAARAIEAIAERMPREEKERAETEALRQQLDTVASLGAGVKEALAAGDYSGAMRAWDAYTPLASGRRDLQGLTDAIRRHIQKVSDERFASAAQSLDRGNLQRASADLRAVAILDPQRSGLTLQQNRLREALRQKKAAEGFDRRKVLEKFSDAVRAFFQYRNYDKAKELLEKVLEMDPSFDKAHELLDKIRRIKGTGR